MANNPSNKLKEWYERQDPEKRLKLIKGGAICGVLAGALGLYYASGQDDKAPPPPPPEVTVIDVGEGRLEDDMRAQLEKQGEEQENQNKAQNAKMETLESKLAAAEQSNAAILEALQKMSQSGAPGLPDGDSSGLSNTNPADWERGVRRPGSTIPASDLNAAPPAPPPVEYVGGIGMAQGVGAIATANGTGDGKKKVGGPSWYLPVSFMKAKLLTGLKAKTVDSARGDPEPILLRVQAPAVLPNEIRAELQGCLVVAHGYGSLASERVEARLVSLNCLDRNGESVIEADINGIVVDKDGVKGLAGHPVSKMGTNLARLAFAAAIEGAGEAFSDQATTTSISPLGQTQSIDSGQIGKAGIGKGVSSAAGEYSKIIAELVRQQAPVLEVGPAKDVTVVLTEGVWLEMTPSRQGAKS